MNFNVAIIKGDGIGPEVVDEAIKVFKKIESKYSHKFILKYAYAGGIAIDKFNDPLPKESIETCLSSDSVLLGAVGGPKWDNIGGNIRPEQGLLKLRSSLGLFSNLRPAILYEPLKDACVLRKDIADKGIDMLVVRELTGGIYFGEHGKMNIDEDEIAWDTEKYSYNEIKRIAKKSFEFAMTRRKKVTSIDKANVLESSRLWRRVVIEVAKDYPEVELNHMYVDNAAMQLIKEPSNFDVILTSNIFGDILSDEASQITGSIGLLPSASIGESKRGMYEPIHGSAPDIAGKDIANPIAAILSVAMMFKYSFDLKEEAEAIERSVFKVLNEGYRTIDIFASGMKKVGTKEMGDLIVSNL